MPAQAIADRLEAFRAVMLANAYRQSPEVDAFTDVVPSHKQFYLDGPELPAEVEFNSLTADGTWLIRAMVQFDASRPGFDKDKGRFEIATEIEALISAWAADSTLHSDVFTVASSSPEYDGDEDLWVVEITAALQHIRNL